MSDETLEAQDEQEKKRAKKLKKMERKLERAEERLVDYERLVDRTQHLLNTRIEEVEAARAELMESEQRFRQLADAAFEAILIHSGETILDCNEAATKLYQVSKKQLLENSFLNRISSSEDAPNHRWLYEPTREPIELTHLRKDGGTVPVEIRSRAIIHKGQKALVTAVRDITTHKAMEAKLQQIANSDPLTGVGNRRFFLDVGRKEYFRAVRYSQPLSLIMLDVDHFKSINDTYGHDIGDVALKALAKVCSNTLRDSDVLARIGGEEFAIVLPGSDLAGGAALAERLRKNVENNVIDTEKGAIKYTISIGITDMRKDDENIETMLNRADKGLYFAKEHGRNQVATE